MKRFTATLIASIAAFGAMAFTPAAAAPAETPSTRVAFADLDMRRDAGARVGLARIESAARAACGARTGPMPLRERIAQRACTRAETAQAVQAAANPGLTAAFYGRRGFVLISD